MLCTQPAGGLHVGPCHCCCVASMEDPVRCMQHASLLVACRWAQPLHKYMPHCPAAWYLSQQRPVRAVQLELCLYDGRLLHCSLYGTCLCWAPAGPKQQALEDFQPLSPQTFAIAAAFPAHARALGFKLIGEQHLLAKTPSTPAACASAGCSAAASMSAGCNLQLALLALRWLVLFRGGLFLAGL